MLPRLLCEELCSLNGGVDRLTFSVVWKMDEKANIFDEWFGRSVIRSRVKLTYEHAQVFFCGINGLWGGFMFLGAFQGRRCCRGLSAGP